MFPAGLSAQTRLLAASSPVETELGLFLHGCQHVDHTLPTSLTSLWPKGPIWKRCLTGSAWGGGSSILQTQSMHHAQNKREGPSLRKKLRSKGAWAADRMSVWTDGIRANREMFKGIWSGQ